MKLKSYDIPSTINAVVDCVLSQVVSFQLTLDKMKGPDLKDQVRFSFYCNSD